MARVNIGEMPTGGGVNPNLLDNWYFPNVVNQRGKDEYIFTSNSYGFDRWFSGNGAAHVKYGGGIKITTKSDFVGGTWALQYLDFDVDVNGKELTASMLLDSGELVTVSGVVDTSHLNYSHLYKEVQYKSRRAIVQFRTYSSSNRNAFGIGIYQPEGEAVELGVIAAKLELGSQQTLAKKNENGEWELTEIPNYTEQYLRCLRYQYVIGNHGTGYIGMGPGELREGAGSVFTLRENIFLPVPLRANPAISVLTTRSDNIVCSLQARVRIGEIKSDNESYYLVLDIYDQKNNATIRFGFKSVEEAVRNAVWASPWLANNVGIILDANML